MHPPSAAANPSITVHLVLNAHIDPVWLWPWQSGLDEALATCRSACDRLDNHPDIIFTRGEAWVYDAVERLDPPLFRRIQAHVAAGRWEIAGGWWIQPDCNQPSAYGMQKQIELGRAYFSSRFGSFPRTAYNVDSFGHSAGLTRLMRTHGQDRYVMMRPQEHELELPARIFRWRGHEGDEEVVTFRIARNYEISQITEEHVMASLQNLPAGARHTMCFVGVGDHGGGPTERQIQWCREHKHAFAGCELVFSSPTRFFDAIAADGIELPLYTGELQYHAVGCYSSMRKIKTAVRDAEHRMRQAEIVAAADSAPDADLATRSDEAWRHICFNHFHDTLGGACVPSAYPQLENQLGAALTFADGTMQFSFRRQLSGLADDVRQRIALCNASDERFDGYLTLAPWTEQLWEPHWRILDHDGRDVPYQIIEQEALARHSPRIVLRTALEPGELRALLIDRTPIESAPAVQCLTLATHCGGRIESGPVSVDVNSAPLVQLPGCMLRPALHLIEDSTGTWAHGVSRFDEHALAEVDWSRIEAVHSGPLLSSIVQHGSLEHSEVIADWRVYAGEPMVELGLRINWHATHRLLKLVLPFDEEIVGRRDGIMGGWIERGRTCHERPMRDFCLIRLRSGMRIGIVCPDVFALDASPQTVRLTLLRSPFMAHHHPSHPATPPHAMPIDQGIHQFRFEFFAGPELEPELLERRALMIHRPILVSDYTRGMTSRSTF
ncbi:MAG TPA: glycoside hydrolase family 38 C-terminal domain-containing protein [Povalibacter sp.]|nr:glycoside hydrolase family 38 C-terminal domain-containing protein [Povalibacter sp.]